MYTTREKNVNQHGEIQEIKAKDFFKRFQKWNTTHYSAQPSEHAVCGLLLS